MKNVLILYHSYSGNTQKIAGYLCDFFQNKNWNVVSKNIKNYNFKLLKMDFDFFILGVPVHYWDIPENVINYIKKLPNLNIDNGFIFTTYGGCISNRIIYSVAKILQLKNIKVNGGAQILMPHSLQVDNYKTFGETNKKFGKGEPTKKQLFRLTKTINQTLENSVNNNDSLNIKRLKSLHTMGFLAMIINSLTSIKQRRSLMPNIEIDKDRCNACFKCVPNCDNSAIFKNSANSIAVNTKLCLKCYKCVNVCPTNSINAKWKNSLKFVLMAQKLSNYKNNFIILK